MAADKIIRNSKLDTFLSKLATKLAAIFWRKAETTQVSIDDTPTANSNNLVKSGGVKSYVDSAIPTVPVTDVTVGGTSVLSNGTAVVPAIPDAVEANPTVPSGTTPTALSNLKVGNDYYAVPQGGSTPLSADVETDKNDNTKASTPKSVYDFVKPQSQSSIPAGGLQPGILYNLSVLTGSVTIDLASPADANVANEYAFTFHTTSTATTITWPNSINSWAGNCLANGAPLIVANKYYEVSILNGVGVIIEADSWL